MSASSDRAYAFIKSAILSGRYRAGARVTEDMVAGELGVSRTPIRDALKRLHLEQLVTVTPYSGARVASWSTAELREVARMREMLESFAAGLAAAKRTTRHIDTMAALCERMEGEAARPEPDLERISTENLAFHRTIVEAADNSRLAGIVEPLWNFSVVVRKYGLFGHERLQRSLIHHREILAAIAKQDAAWAEAIMRVHILAAGSFDAALSDADEAEIDGAGAALIAMAQEAER